MENIMSMITKDPDSDELCDIETFKEMIRDLDKNWSANTRKKTKLAAEDKRKDHSGVGVAKVYPRSKFLELGDALTKF